MTKFVLSALAATCIFTFNSLAAPTPAQAQRNINQGFCPTGTCANDGTNRALNVRNCRPQNCRGAAPAGTKKR